VTDTTGMKAYGAGEAIPVRWFNGSLAVDHVFAI
jgi:hypothetical protein